MKTVVLTETVHAEGVELLRSRSDIEVVLAQGLPLEDFARSIARANVIGVRTMKLGADLLASGTSLQLVSKHGIGCDNIAVDHLSSRGIPVAITANANAGSVAEHTLMLMLAAARKVLVYDRHTREGDWEFRKSAISGDLADRTVLVVGFGRIGRRVSMLCAAFGMKVLVFDRMVSASTVKAAGHESATDLDAALGEADFTTLHMPLTPATASLFDAGRLARMKRGAVLINCSRGGIVDEKELCRLLASGHIGGAGFDVFEHEPPPRDHPLLSAPNAVLTPHSAAFTREGSLKMAMAMAQNILDFLDDRLDRNMVFNFEALNDAPALGSIA